MASMRGVRRPLLVVALVAVVAPLVALLLLSAAAQRTAPARRSPPIAQQRTAQLDGPGLADLRMVRREAGRQAEAVSSAVTRCLRDGRGRAARVCAFRPLAAAGAGRNVNALILARIGARLTPGPCSRSIGSYRALLMQFGLMADEALRAPGASAEQRGYLRAGARLASAVERAGRAGPWRTSCAAPRLGDAPAA